MTQGTSSAISANIAIATSASASAGTKGMAAITVKGREKQPSGIETVTVSPQTRTLDAIGDNTQLAATARDAKGNAISDASFTWTSSRYGSGDCRRGRESDLPRRGRCTDRLWLRVECPIPQPLPRVRWSHPLRSARAAPVWTLARPSSSKATAKDANGNPISGQTFDWSSSKSSTATVSSSGRVKGNKRRIGVDQGDGGSEEWYGVCSSRRSDADAPPNLTRSAPLGWGRHLDLAG